MAAPYLRAWTDWTTANLGPVGNVLTIVALMGGAYAFAMFFERRHARKHYQSTGEIVVPPKPPKAEPAVILTRWVVGGIIGLSLLASALGGFQ